MTVPQGELTAFVEEQLKASGHLQDPDEFHLLMNFHTDLGMDSLDVFTLIFEIEETFGVKVPEDVINNSLTIEGLLRSINSNATTPEES